jgi:predicted O-linked N-acetylglucosamine transferase (SPINDLY family)
MNRADIRQQLERAINHHQAGRLQEAETAYRQILNGDPNNAVAMRLLGLIAEKLGYFDQAEELITGALEVQPDYTEAHFNLGTIFLNQGRLDESIASNRKAVSCDQNHAKAHNNLGIAFEGLGELDAAIASYQRALAIKPDFAEVHNNLSTLQMNQGELDAAVASCQSALAIKPDFVSAHNNLGNAYKELGLMDVAIACYQDAITIDPDYIFALSNLVVTMPFLTQFNPADVFAASRRAGMVLEKPVVEPSPHHANSRDPNRPLNVGYLSPSLTEHVLSPYLEPVLKAHRRDLVSVHVYAHVPIPDDTTWRLKELADSWTFVHDLTDDQVAEQIIEDGIDILVDPMGHWSSNRLAVFARKPAPIQVSYLCQNLTTGLSGMDYVIGDRWLNEGGVMQKFATEKVVELNDGFQTTSYDIETPIGEVPSVAAGFVNFASFNNPAKISDSCLRLWASVLNELPTARLLIKGGRLEHPEKRSLLMRRLEEHGIPTEKIDLRGFVMEGDHMDVHNVVDIALDTTPFTGGRTTVDALWMGVPVVTLIGESVFGRYSYSHLNRAAVPELAARNEEEFVEIAVNLAGDIARLKHYRNTLRPALKASSLLDASSHVVELEEAYSTMWRRWCAGMVPEAFTISSIKKI